MYAAFPMYAQLFELNTSHWGLSSSGFAFNLPTVKFTKFIPSKLLIWVPLVLLQLPGAQKKEEELKADASLFFQTSVLLLQEPVAGPRRFDVCGLSYVCAVVRIEHKSLGETSASVPRESPQ